MKRFTLLSIDSDFSNDVRKRNPMNPASSNMKKVSIVTVVYNGAQTLERTILSVLNQTYPNIEYIVIDGGSTDGTVDLIKKHQERLAFWGSEPDKGIYDAMNKGIRRASGDLIALLNADDWYEPDAVETMIRNIPKDMDLFLLHGDLLLHKKNQIPKFIPGGDVVDSNQISLPVRHPTCFVSSAAYRKIGLYSTEYKIVSDIDFFYRALKMDIPFIHVNHVIANMQAMGLSQKSFVQSYQEGARLRRKYGFSSFQIFRWKYKNLLLLHLKRFF